MFGKKGKQVVGKETVHSCGAYFAASLRREPAQLTSTPSSTHLPRFPPTVKALAFGDEHQSVTLTPTGAVRASPRAARAIAAMV